MTAVATVSAPIEVRPFLDWCRAREAELARLHDRPLWALLGELGWADDSGRRRLDRWRQEPDTLGARTLIEAALEHADAEWEAVYGEAPIVSDPPSRWCGWCAEAVPVRELRCAWCGRQTVARRPYPRRSDGFHGWLSDDALLRLHEIHRDRGVSAQELGRRLYARTPYASASACAQAIRRGWRVLGLACRDRVSATVLARFGDQACCPRGHEWTPENTYMDGRGRRQCRACARQRKAAPKVRCVGVKSSGVRCGGWASHGSTTCWVHDPERVADRVSAAGVARAAKALA